MGFFAGLMVPTLGTAGGGVAASALTLAVLEKLRDTATLHLNCGSRWTACRPRRKDMNALRPSRSVTVGLEVKQRDLRNDTVILDHSRACCLSDCCPQNTPNTSPTVF